MSAGAEPAVWLVDGDDPVLLAEATRDLLGRLLAGEDPALALEDAGEEADLAAVADACRTPPFLGQRRVVVVRHIGSRPVDELAPILEYLRQPLPTTSLVLVGGGGKPPARLVAAVKANGRLVSTAVSGREVRSWVHQRVTESPVRLEAAAESLLAEHLGEDFPRLGTLLEVLAAAYGEGARVGVAELRPYLGEAGGVAPWDLTDAIDSGETERALSVLHRLLGAGDRHPLVVLATLHRHVASVLKVESPAIRTEQEAATAMGIPPGRSTYPAKKALLAARTLGPAGVADAIGLVADAEVALKGGIDWPDALVLEVLVSRLCFLARYRTGGRPRSPR
jgi:DNA polymerase-3 subunit delta